MSDNLPSLIRKVEDLLPQTQCERCGFKGCRPYAEHVVRDKGHVNLCHPGGQITADAIATLLKRNKQQVAHQPAAQQVARIHEPVCIGCTKCIQVCPVDAIVGASKHMHTVLESECTGCELCVPACPVACIDLKAMSNEPTWIAKAPQSAKARADYSKQRFIDRSERLNKQKHDKQSIRQAKTKVDIQSELAKILERTKAKKVELCHE